LNSPGFSSGLFLCESGSRDGVAGRPPWPLPTGLGRFLSEIHALKVDLYLHQQGIDTTTPAGKAMFQMMGVFAEFERSMIQERVRAGIARAADGVYPLRNPRC
jgi:DNA invertase Pin-like site-specific DNA recombinase